MGIKYACGQHTNKINVFFPVFEVAHGAGCDVTNADRPALYRVSCIFIVLYIIAHCWLPYLMPGVLCLLTLKKCELLL